MATRVTQLAVESLGQDFTYTGYRFGFPSKPKQALLQPYWGAEKSAMSIMPFIDIGGAARDFQNPDYLGQLNAGTVYNTGPFGTQVFYSGNSYVLLANAANSRSPDPTGLSAFTVAVLAQGNNNGAFGASNFSYLSAKEANSALTYTLRYYTNSYNLGWVVNGCSEITPSLGFFDVLDWHLYVGVFNAGSLQLWVDGIMIGSNSGGASTIGSVASGSTQIGNGQVGSPGDLRPWSGQIAAHYMWASALTEQDIIHLSADPFAPVRAPIDRAWLSLFITNRTVFRRTLSGQGTRTGERQKHAWGST